MLQKKIETKISQLIKHPCFLFQLREGFISVRDVLKNPQVKKAVL
jgi:hypothetical protein